MTDPFDREDEAIDSVDEEREHPVFQQLAKLKVGSKIYMILGAEQKTEDEHLRQIRLLLVRRDDEDENVREYVVCDDEKEIEDVVELFVAESLQSIARQAVQEAGDTDGCILEHAPGEFCYCGMPEYLQ